ncbi:MAG: hypothetical protein NTZ46_07685 [Verrucomicrobia bacterium]|nr:hypothetical protein [Verrucomicrobiota bacterium]
MTIAEAIAKYKSGDCDSPALGAIINQMIDTNTKTEFANDSYVDALYLTDLMFRRSTKSIRLLTGPGVDTFLSALKEPFIEALNRIKKEGGNVRAVILSAELPEWLRELSQQYQTVFQICRARSSKPIKHFIVCDSCMARLEEFHGETNAESSASEIKAQVYFSEPEKAKVFEEHFDSIWKTVAEFPINKPTGV